MTGHLESLGSNNGHASDEDQALFASVDRYVSSRRVDDFGNASKPITNGGAANTYEREPGDEPGEPTVEEADPNELIRPPHKGFPPSRNIDFGHDRGDPPTGRVTDGGHTIKRASDGQEWFQDGDGVVRYVDEPEDRSPPLPRIWSLGELVDVHPRLRPAVIEQWLREGEVANIIAKSKMGKSWTGYGLLWSVATGTPWLGRFNTTAGRVLLIDNELHHENLAHRIPAVADALGIKWSDYRDQFQVVPLRGDLLGVSALDRLIDSIEPGTYRLITIDAFYRILPGGTSENDNAAVAEIYNRIDQWAKKTGAAFVLIHHTSKGSQSEKDVTDVGSGAGSQSRAADAHLILRPHEEEGFVVLDGAVRSWPPLKPIALGWSFPIWYVAEDRDPEALKGKKSRGEEKQCKNDDEADNAIIDACEGWKTRGELKKLTGFGRDRVDRGIARLVRGKYLESGQEDRPRHPATEVFRKTLNARD